VTFYIAVNNNEDYLGQDKNIKDSTCKKFVSIPSNSYSPVVHFRIYAFSNSVQSRD
jgi:hypothetical protein